MPLKPLPSHQSHLNPLGADGPDSFYKGGESDLPVIFHLEDDWEYASLIEDILKKSSRSCRVERVSTEAEFIHRLREITSRATAVLLDDQVRWDEVEGGLPDIKQEENCDFRDAGYRCAQRLLENTEFKGKVVFYGIRDENEIGNLLEDIRNQNKRRQHPVDLTWLDKSSARNPNHDAELCRALGLKK